VKDPFRVALAARSLPFFVSHPHFANGGALTDAMANRARKETRSNPRYEWLGELSRSHVRRILAKSRLA